MAAITEKSSPTRRHPYDWDRRTTAPLTNAKRRLTYAKKAVGLADVNYEKQKAAALKRVEKEQAEVDRLLALEAERAEHRPTEYESFIENFEQ